MRQQYRGGDRVKKARKGQRSYGLPVHTHDRCFKCMISIPEVAYEFFEAHLPSKILSRIDLTTLKLRQGDFLDGEFRRRTVDILYEVQLDGKEAFLLVEHQSTPDNSIIYRINEYMARIYAYYREHGGKRGLPIIYPMVFYSGSKRYNPPRKFSEMVVDEELYEWIKAEGLQVIKAQEMGEEELRSRKWCGIMEGLMKHIHQEDLLEFLKGMQANLSEVAQENIEILRIAVSYILSQGERVKSTKEILKVVEEAIPQEKQEEVMKIADMLYEEGRVEGKMEGLMLGVQRGKLEGKLEEKQEVALRLLKLGMAIDVIATVTGLTKEKVEQLMLGNNHIN